MIYVSSSCVKHNKIKDSVEELANNGFQNIELSGGTNYYEKIVEDLVNLKEKYDLNYICHNYFPPPKKHLVLNLASLDDNIYNRTLEHFKNALRLAKELKTNKFGLHAGFFIDIKVNEIGKELSKVSIYNKELSINRFSEAFKILNSYEPSIQLYIENNALSLTNYTTYKENIFMLTCYNEYQALKSSLDFKLLLDIAHLKVSCNSLGLHFQNELNKMLINCDYMHISDNDSFHDLNQLITENTDFLETLKSTNLKNKTFTLEVYDSLSNIRRSHDLLQKAIND